MFGSVGERKKLSLFPLMLTNFQKFEKNCYQITNRINSTDLVYMLGLKALYLIAIKEMNRAQYPCFLNKLV